MKLETGKYDKRVPEHYRALLHVIGQLEDVKQRGATIAEVARFMNVSKPTAKSVLSAMVNNGILIVINNKEFGNFGRKQYELSRKARHSYDSSVWRSSYIFYCQRVLKVVLQDA